MLKSVNHIICKKKNDRNKGISKFIRLLITYQHRKYNSQQVKHFFTHLLDQNCNKMQSPNSAKLITKTIKFNCHICIKRNIN